jgi:anti-sigma-K factor RskA
MDTVLSQGGNREHSWRVRILAAIAVLAVLAVVIAGHLPHGRTVLARHRATAVTAGPVQLAGLGSGAAGLLNQADRGHRASLATGRKH